MEMDEVERKPPVCGTAACIGGSISLLTGHKGSTEKLGALLGLNENQADVLFYHWNDERCWDSASWPLDIKDDFAAANTPVKKERVAERMIKRALKDPSCLDPQ